MRNSLIREKGGQQLQLAKSRAVQLPCHLSRLLSLSLLQAGVRVGVRGDGGVVQEGSIPKEQE